ncbi:PiggyBac transposable element-derived protein 3 [Plakobranchus ocellatus]|uniref:PiggyBac transposable element-derived protein 3 n=1 Tax=Plakobranchus ocellatus TaxID=259542 RepID=A0AAV4BHS0_9GAST|nr:PiggyBac transposable element-derived protein 3 [Plakobranchus ocellatus]
MAEQLLQQMSLNGCKLSMMIQAIIFALHHHSLELAIRSQLWYQRHCKLLVVKETKLSSFLEQVTSALIMVDKRKPGRPSLDKPRTPTISAKNVCEQLPLTAGVRLDHRHQWGARQTYKMPKCKEKSFVYCRKCQVHLCLNTTRNCFDEVHTRATLILKVTQMMIFPICIYIGFYYPDPLDTSIDLQQSKMLTPQKNTTPHSSFMFQAFYFRTRTTLDIGTSPFKSPLKSSTPKNCEMSTSPLVKGEETFILSQSIMQPLSTIEDKLSTHLVKRKLNTGTDADKPTLMIKNKRSASLF